MKAIIIDDEPDCVSLLALQLKLYCPQIQVIAECTESDEGLRAIQELSPDIVFLDIEMPRMNGFQVLEALEEITFALIFVTAYDKFAVKAFRFSAIDYLLKPVDVQELKIAIQKVEKNQRTDEQQITVLKQELQITEKTSPEKIALPYHNKAIFVETKQIIYCEADSNYTAFFIAGGQKYLICKTLREVEEMLEGRTFLRVHRKYLVNLDHATNFIRGETCFLVMSDKQSIPVARNHKEQLKEKFGWL